MIKWTEPRLKELIKDISSDIFGNIIVEGSASFSKVAQMAQTTGGHNIFVFDEIGLFNAVWAVDPSGRGSEQTAALTSIYVGQPISRSFIGDEYSAEVKRPIWNLMLCTQHEPLKESLQAHQTSGLMGRFGVVLCEADPTQIHENRIHFSTTDYNLTLDKYFGAIVNNGITNAYAQTIQTRMASNDHHLVFQADPSTEMYLFCYNVLVIMFIRNQVTKGQSLDRGLCTQLRKSTLLVDKYAALITAIEEFCTNQAAPYFINSEYARSCWQARTHDSILTIVNKYNVLYYKHQ